MSNEPIASPEASVVGEAGLSEPGNCVPLLELSDCTVCFGRFTAAHAVSLSVASGTVVGLIGPNGAGKSVLIDAISGFVPLARGSVRFLGGDISGSSPLRRARLGIRRTFQGCELFEDLTVRENLRVAAASGSEYEAIIDGYDLGSVSEELGKNLPAGLRRRVALARAVVGKPRLLLADEPGAGLALDEVWQMSSSLRDCASDGAGILLVDHDMRMIEMSCDVVYAIVSGVIVAVGTPATIRNEKAVREAYFGE